MYLTAGIQLLPQLRVGGGLVYYRTTEHLVRGVNFLSQERHNRLRTAGDAFSYDLSRNPRPSHVPLAFAVDYKHQGVMNLAGHAHATTYAGAAAELLDQEVTHMLTYPNQVNSACRSSCRCPRRCSSRASPGSATTYTRRRFRGDRGVWVVVPRNYRTATPSGRRRGDANMPGLRAGALRDISPSRTDTLEPRLPDPT